MASALPHWACCMTGDHSAACLPDSPAGVSILHVPLRQLHNGADQPQAVQHVHHGQPPLVPGGVQPGPLLLLRDVPCRVRCSKSPSAKDWVHQGSSQNMCCCLIEVSPADYVICKTVTQTIWTFCPGKLCQEVCCFQGIVSAEQIPGDALAGQAQAWTGICAVAAKA